MSVVRHDKSRSFLRAAWLLLCLAAAVPAHAALVFVDDAGRSTVLERPAQRVITLAPSLTEMVYAVGAGDTLVGTLDSSNFPAAAKAVPRVGDHQRLDIERIVALKPEVVLAWHHGNSERELEQIEAAGLHVVRLEPNRLADVPRAIERIGVLTGHGAQAMKSAEALRSELTALRLRYGSGAPVSVFFQVWTRPLMTLGGPQLISDVIGLCGGHNVFADLEPLAPQVSTEAVVAAAPQALLTTRQGHGDPADLAFTRSPADPVYAMWSPFTSIPAVRHGWMFLLPGDVLVRQGPRIGQGARAVCEALDVVRRERR